MTQAKYYSVFFDVDKPQNRNNALVLKVDKKKFANLLDEAIPDKNVELKFTDGIETKYIIKSRQTFWTNEFDLIDGQASNCFIICNVKKVKVSELNSWLSKQKELEKVNDLFYRFFFEGKWCAGKVTITPDCEEIQIRPNLNTHDIGKGPGAPVYKKFNRLK